jgi:ParB-like chromosome segregation protein Spo0J
MSVGTLQASSLPPVRAELVPLYFDSDLIVTPDDNPAPTQAMLDSLLASIREHGQLVPGWVCPSPDLPQNKRLCLEGNHRLAVARLLGNPFWAFDLQKFVPEEERIRLTFQHNHSRRVMSRDETAEKASRFIELTGCTNAEAARLLNVSPPTLSRAFGERRIPPELKPLADQLGLAVRSLIAALPPLLMRQALDFALAAGPDGKRPTRDAVAGFSRQLKKTGRPKARKSKAITLRVSGRAVTLAVGERDTASTVAEDLKAIVAKLGRHAEVPPDGWPFLFQ